MRVTTTQKRCPALLALGLAKIIVLTSCLCSMPAHSQGLPAADGALNNGGGSGADKRHRDALGNLCLQVNPVARPQIVNPNIYDQLLVIRNQCNRSIKIRVCYYNTDHCVENEIPALTRKDTIIGVSPMVKYFRYGIREF